MNRIYQTRIALSNAPRTLGRCAALIAGGSLAVALLAVPLLPGTLRAAHAQTAVQLQPIVTPFSGPRLELTGPITALAGGQATLSGLVFDLSRAEVRGTLAVGSLVSVEARFIDGRWVAREVEVAGVPVATALPGTVVATPPVMTPQVGVPGIGQRQTELYGLVMLIEPGFVTVSGQRVDIRMAEVEGQIGIGTVVKVHVTGVPGAYLAREIEPIDSDDLSQGDLLAVYAGGLITDDDDTDNDGDSSNDDGVRWDDDNASDDGTDDNSGSSNDDNSSDDNNSSNDDNSSDDSNSSNNSSDDGNDDNSGSDNDDDGGSD